MKQLLTILLILVSFTAFSQYADSTTTKNKKASNKVATPGDCLIKASNSQMGAYFAFAFGGAMTYCVISNKVPDEQKGACRIVSIASFAVGVILQVNHTILIGKAGKLMNEQQKSITFKASPTGAGLAINF